MRLIRRKNPQTGRARVLSATPQCVKQNERGQSLQLGSVPLDIILDASEQSLFGQVPLRLDTSHLCDSKKFFILL